MTPYLAALALPLNWLVARVTFSCVWPDAIRIGSLIWLIGVIAYYGIGR